MQLPEAKRSTQLPMLRRGVSPLDYQSHRDIFRLPSFENHDFRPGNPVLFSKKFSMAKGKGEDSDTSSVSGSQSGPTQTLLELKA